MHIPDGFLPISQAAVYWVIALILIAFSLRWAKREMSEEKVPLVAVLAAGIFAIQTLNMALPISFIPGGVSGHVVGAALPAIVLWFSVCRYLHSHARPDSPGNILW